MILPFAVQMIVRVPGEWRRFVIYAYFTDHCLVLSASGPYNEGLKGGERLVKQQFPLRCARDGGCTKFGEIMTHSEAGETHRVFIGCAQRDGSQACGDCLSDFQELLKNNPSVSPATLAQFHAAR